MPKLLLCSLLCGFPLLSHAQLPALTSSLPARQTLTASPGGPVRLTFSGPVANPDPIRVNTDQRRGQRAGTLSGAGTSQVEFRPEQPFAPGERVSVSVPASVSRPAQVLEFRAAAGRGRATFGPPQTASPNINTFPAAVIAGDVDNDGDQDLIIGEAVGGRICFNDGKGNFLTTPTQPIPITNNAGDLLLADFNGDGNLDILASTARQVSEVGLNLGNGQGDFSNRTTVFRGMLSKVQFVTGDFNADGLTDAVFMDAEGAGSVLQLMLGTRSGNFVLEPRQLATLPGRDIGVADMDADGDLDLLLVSDKLLGVYLNDGNGQFSAGATLAVNGFSAKLTVGDFTGDGHADVVCTSYETASLSLVPGDGAGGLLAVRNVSALSPTWQVSSADMDGDLDLDLLATNDRGITQVLLNDGSGQFAPASAILIGFDLFFTADAADLNGDGALDVYTSKQIFNPVNPRGIDIFFNQPPLVTSAAAAARAGQLVLYPNPAHGQTTLELPASPEPTAVEVRDALGRLVQTLTVAPGPATRTVPVPLAELVPGVYSVRARTSRWRGVQRLLVE
ncbi:T9SS type A sorting domain-containing protein [Hymenobacter psychrophilus]|uniref:Por secretion system C-terminal sorting domain-containing protein n=1 Tax=Hymenobacter psychrophilus TaxID=651662 RepID=A0A1H3EUK7_9BACT|nr:T9SS type A sorting domain-containing protein [Hymenobacter psychrophilus]SDX81798.1 Por secretion system C-terminal sorting domain-containing protein [Hymenobacter psychrophilus]